MEKGTHWRGGDKAGGHGSGSRAAGRAMHWTEAAAVGRRGESEARATDGEKQMLQCPCGRDGWKREEQRLIRGF